MAPSARVVVIDEAQRNRLEAVVRARTTHVRDVQRAQIVLSAADGMSNVAIARALSICQNTVRTWRGRFADHAMPGLGRWCLSRVADRADVIALGQWSQRISLSVLGVRDDVGVGAETG